MYTVLHGQPHPQLGECHVHRHVEVYVLQPWVDGYAMPVGQEGLYKAGCHRRPPALCRRVQQQQWQAVPLSMLVELVNSVPQRIKECINGGGDKTPH